MSITQLLLEFLMNLLKDPEAAEEFQKDPEGVLEAHGLGNITVDDVDAVVPVVVDFAPVSTIGERVFETGGNTATGGDSSYSAPASGGAGGGGGGGGYTPQADAGAAASLSPAAAQLTHVVNNFSYTSVDDRDTITDQSVNQNIWALGDVEQWFDNEANVASGDGAVAAGDDAAVDNSVDNSTNIHAGEDVNIGNTSIAVEDSYNDDHSTDNSVHVDVALEDSLNATDSFNDNSDNSTDNSTNVSLEDSLNATDSFNDNSDNSDNSINDSFNTDNSLNATDSFNTDNSLNDSLNTTDSLNGSLNTTDVDADVDIDDSFNDVDVALEDSFNDNSTNVETGDIDAEFTNVETGDIDAEFTNIEDSLVVANNELDVDVEDGHGHHEEPAY